jgi:hypothetical protein
MLPETEPTVSQALGQGESETKVEFRRDTICYVPQRIGRPTYTPAEQERIREVASRVLADQFKANRKHFGAALGISGQAAGKVARTGGAATATVERLAKLAKMTVDEILGRKPAPSVAYVGAALATRSTELDVRYPNLRRAADFARGEGLSEEAIVAILNMVHDSPQDLRPSEWLKRIERKDAVLEEQRREPAKEEQAAARDQKRVDEAAAAMKPRIKKRSSSSTQG